MSEEKEFKVGDEVWLDIGTVSECIVEILSIGQLFCYVRDNQDGYEWSTMVYRLTHPAITFRKH